MASGLLIQSENSISSVEEGNSTYFNYADNGIPIDAICFGLPVLNKF